MKKITILHNEKDEFDLNNSGFSLLIEDNGKKILFDFGLKGEIFTNLKSLNLDIDLIDYFVVSHGHIDHIETIKEITLKSPKPLIFHPKAIIPKFYKSQSIGFTPEIMSNLDNFEIKMTKDVKQITENVFFIGEVPTNHNFEKENTGHTCFGDDHLEDDSGLVLKTEAGLVLISGCAHSGICSMLEYVEDKFSKKVIAILGGIHLLERNRTIETINYLKKLKIDINYGHCVNNFSDEELRKIGGKHFKTLQEFTWK